MLNDPNKRFLESLAFAHSNSPTLNVALLENPGPSTIELWVSNLFRSLRRKDGNSLLNRGLFEIAEEVEDLGLKFFGSQFVGTINDEEAKHPWKDFVLEGFSVKLNIYTHTARYRKNFNVFFWCGNLQFKVYSFAW